MVFYSIGDNENSKFGGIFMFRTNFCLLFSCFRFSFFFLWQLLCFPFSLLVLLL